MRILYVAPRYDYGKPGQGFSFEHHNFYDFLARSGHDVIYFDFLNEEAKPGKAAMNRRLVDLASVEKPDLMFCVLFTDELDPDAVKQVSSSGVTTTLNWFCDDHWRFDNYSKHWAPCFNWVVTTAKSAVPKYAALNYANVIKSQWGCNHLLYRQLDLPLLHDVSFVGQPHGNRRQIIQKLAESGIHVKTFGAGWGSGRISQEEMIRVFNQSRINLNLSNASVPANRVLHLVARTFNRPPLRYFEQIKGRNFEVPGCGGFMLSGHAEDLESYYSPGKEIACFDNIADLIDKIRYYLSHERERAEIAHAGYERTVREHTYAHRFAQIFERLQLP